MRQTILTELQFFLAKRQNQTSDLLTDVGKLN